MGSTNGDSDERPVHTVSITEPFYLQKTEVTQGQWNAVMGTNPARFSSCGELCPVEQVSWDDVQLFLRRLNELDPGKGYRLPAEAEWEYACRAGTTGDYGGTGNLEEMGWHSENSGSQTHTVAEKRPNAWGLYDMHGNVWEWVQESYGPYPEGGVPDPAQPSTRTARVLRGGSWFSHGVNTRCARRYGYPPSYKDYAGGFRLAMSS